MQPAVFFDRDGVIIETEVRDGKPYAIRDPQQLKIFPAALPLMQNFKQAGYKIVVVTNQPDVGNGLVTQQTVETMHAKLLAELPIDLIEVCYHSQQAGCKCRKPDIAMFSTAAERLNLDLSASLMIGDRNSDVAAGNRAGCFTLFIDYGYNEPLVAHANLIVRSLSEILEQQMEIMELLKYERSQS
jgi:D-glycero-D-manno-heptose 1,7-bisphosphate phosphatase